MQQGDSSSELSQKRSAAARLIEMGQDTALAVIRIDRAGLLPLFLADSDSLRRGQIVLTIGNPMALENSGSIGVIGSDDPNRLIDKVRENSRLVPRVGILAGDVNENVLKKISELRKPAGVLVAARVTDQPGSEEDLSPGDLIIAL